VPRAAPRPAKGKPASRASRTHSAPPDDSRGDAPGPSDRVFLEGLVLRARIGVTAAERAAPQDLQADIAIHAPLEKPGRTDRLADTVNYALIRKTALRVAGSRTWSLLEALATEIAAALLDIFPRGRSVVITLRKPRPPFMSGVGAGGVTLVRRRGVSRR